MRVLWLNPVLVIVLASTLLLCGRSAKAQELPVGAEGVLLERDIEFDRVTAEKGLDGFLSFIAEEAAFSPQRPHRQRQGSGARPLGAPAHLAGRVLALEAAEGRLGSLRRSGLHLRHL